MATIRDKLLASAQRQVDKGNLARAIRDYKKLLDVQPDDTRTRLRIGDLQARMGKKGSATDTYEQVASDYSDQGFFLKAVAILKQILRLDPGRTDVQVRLADLYLKLNLLSDCMAQYRKVADSFRENGDMQRYVDVLRRMSHIDPQDVRVQITLAEHFARSERAEDAGEHFRLAAEGLAHQERWDEYVKVAERYIFHRNDDLDAIKALVGVYLERRDFKRALAKLQLAFKIDPADVEGLDQLAWAFLGLGRQEKALRVLKELAEVLNVEGREDEALDTYQRILDLEPYDVDARVRLGLSMPSGFPTMQAAEVAVPEAASDLRLEGSKPIRINDLPAGGVEQWRRLKAQSGLFATPTGLFTCNSGVSEAALEEIGRLIVEIDGFEKLGLIERARAALKRIFEIDPLNISAMERAVRIDLARGSVEGAIQRLLRMTRLCWRPDPVRAAGYLNESLKHDPDHPSALQLRGELGLDGIDLETFMLETSDVEIIEVGDISGLGDSVLPLTGASDPPGDFVYELADTFGSEAGDEVYIQVERDSESRDSAILYDPAPADRSTPGRTGLSQPLGAVPPEEPTTIEVGDIEIHEVDVDDDLGIDDDDLFLDPDEPQDDLSDTNAPAPRAQPISSGAVEGDPAAALSAALGGDAVPVGQRAAAIPLGPPPERAHPPSAPMSSPVGQSSGSAVWRGTPRSAQHQPPAETPEVDPGLPDELVDDLEELAFFMNAGMRDEAQNLLFDLTTSHPEHTVLIMERMSDLEQSVTQRD